MGSGDWGTGDDVIRIRIDTARAVEDFLDLLAAQAAEGETRSPANPANRAVFREIAPYRLVEYSYVDGGVGAIEGAYVGFPDGSIYSAGDDIPEAVVDALVAGEVASLPPVYVYVVLERPAGPEAVGHYLDQLAHHVGLTVVGVFRRADGALVASAHGPGPAPAGMLAACAGEADRHLSKAEVVERFAAGSRRPDGRAYAGLTYAFATSQLEFASGGGRDDFVAWSRRLAGWLDHHHLGWADLGFSEVFRPAVAAPVPTDGAPVTQLEPPCAWQGGKAAAAFDGATAPERTLALAREYWAYVKEAVDATRREVAEAV